MQTERTRKNNFKNPITSPSSSITLRSAFYPLEPDFELGPGPGPAASSDRQLQTVVLQVRLHGPVRVRASHYRRVCPRGRLLG